MFFKNMYKNAIDNRNKSVSFDFKKRVVKHNESKKYWSKKAVYWFKLAKKHNEL